MMGKSILFWAGPDFYPYHLFQEDFQAHPSPKESIVLHFHIVYCLSDCIDYIFISTCHILLIFIQDTCVAIR